MKFKTKTNSKKIYLAVFLLAVVFGFGFLKAPNASASTCVCSDSGTGSNGTPITASSAQDCTSKCGSGKRSTYTDDNGNVTQTDNGATTNTTQTALLAQQNGNDVCGGYLHGLTNPIQCILLYILKFITILITIAATLFNMVVDPKIFTTIVGNPAIYTAWADVRDVLNVVFIMVLLFSAFCTVFQIDKFNYKKILLTLVIMALLVNFSYPIALFIIDAANVLMYYFINTLGISTQTGSIWATFANSSGFAKIFNPGTSADIPQLIASIVFAFMFAVTLLMVGALLLVRIIVLAVLVVFASVAFVGSITPGLSSHASKWWDTLFKQAFFGPIMIFMVYIALALMQAMITGNVQTQFTSMANTLGGGTYGAFIGELAFFMIPVAILWIGLGFAQSMGAMGASAARKYSFGAMKWATKAPGKAAWYGIKKSGATGGAKKSWDRSYFGAAQIKSRQEKRDDWFYGKFPQGKVDHEQEMKKRAEEYKKENESDDSLRKKAGTGDLGAAYRLASDGKMDDATYKSTMAKIGTIKKAAIRKKLIEEFEGKTKEKNIDVVINYKINTTSGARGDINQETDIAKGYFKDLSPDKWKEQNIGRIAADSAMTQAAHETYSVMTPKNQDEVTDNMKGDKYAAGGGGRIW